MLLTAENILKPIVMPLLVADTLSSISIGLLTEFQPTSGDVLTVVIVYRRGTYMFILKRSKEGDEFEVIRPASY